MKKLFTLIVLLMTAVSAVFALSESAIVLHHGDEVTVFDGPDKIGAAIDAAVDGDIIFLNKGTYAGFTVSKDITIRGAGNDQTRIAGSIYVTFAQEEVEEGAEIPQRTTLEGLYCQNSIYWNTSSTNRKISKCNFNYFDQSKSSKNYNFTIDRCMCRGSFTHSNYFDGLNIINSKIHIFDVGSSNTTSTNIVLYRSNIYTMADSYYFRGSIINCIIGGRYDNNYYHNRFVFTNILNSFVGYGMTIESSVQWDNSYTINQELIDYYTSECLYPSDEKLDALFGENPPSLKYSDVGCYSGDTPFTLAISAPTVKTAQIDVDNAKKTLNVHISLVGDVDEDDEVNEESAE